MSWIVSGRRTAVVPQGGAFRRLEIHHLVAPVIRACLADAGLHPQDVDEVILSNALGAGGNPGYAHEMRGQNFLVARRLVEAGVPFVNVYDFKQQGQNWDAHAKCADQHKKYLLPPLDRGLSALIEDLDDRGLLDSTLVVVTGEFGRTPKINAGAGRDHWPECSSVFLAGGGVVGGAVHGSSDRLGAFPATNPATPGDLAATIFARFGIDPGTEIRDHAKRPYTLSTGEPFTRLFT